MSTTGTEHPFTQYVRILGKGPNLSRHLTEEETYQAMRLVLAGEVLPEQLGAFMCLLRVRTELPQEAAGFLRAVGETIDVPAGAPAVDLNWTSYAGKKRQDPWYLLAALLLADSGVTVFMHGGEGHTEGRLYASEALGALGVPTATSLEEAGGLMARSGFAYMTLANLAPRVNDLMLGLRPVLGLRTPLQSFARMLNPFKAPTEVHGIFHPAYRDLHRGTAELIGQPRMAVLKGEGGEFERRPDKPCEVHVLVDGATAEEIWPARLEGVADKQDSLDPARLGAVWRGEVEDDYARLSVIGTAAVVLKLMGKADTMDAAEAQAAALWQDRNRERPRAAA